MYFAWADAGLNPRLGVEYYEQVSERMGPSTSNFFRVFMVPGMFHCDGGVGVSAFDAMTPLVRWVEKAVVPERIIGSRIIEGKTIPHSSALSLSAGGEIHRHQKHRRCRPLCLPPAITAPDCRPMSLMTKVASGKFGYEYLISWIHKASDRFRTQRQSFSGCRTIAQADPELPEAHKKTSSPEPLFVLRGKLLDNRYILY